MNIQTLKAISGLFDDPWYQIILFKRNKMDFAIYNREGFFELPSQNLKVLDQELEKFVLEHNFVAGQEVRIQHNNLNIRIDQITEDGLYSCTKTSSNLKLGEFADFEIKI